MIACGAQRGAYEGQLSLSQHGIKTDSQARSRQPNFVATGLGMCAGGGGVLCLARVCVCGVWHSQSHGFGVAACHVVCSGVWLAVVHAGAAAQCCWSACLGMVVPYGVVAVFVVDVRAYHGLQAA